MNIREKILKYLSTSSLGATREDIQVATGYSNGSLKNALAQLTGRGLAIESNSIYRLTEEGIEAASHPERVSFSAVKPRVKKPDEIINQIFDWDDIQTSSACRGVLDSNVEDSPWIDLLAPIVIVYLKAKGIEFPAITLAVAENSNDETLEMIYNDFIDKLMDNIA